MSLVSTINRNVSAEEIALIKEEGRREAESDIAELSVNEVADLRSSQWTIEEKWILLWATEYAKLKFKKATERCAEWQRIVRYHCPNKRHAPKSRLNTQKNNVQKANLFSQADVDSMMEVIRSMVQNDICPLENPIQPPNAPLQPEDQNIELCNSQPATPSTPLTPPTQYSPDSQTHAKRLMSTPIGQQPSMQPSGISPIQTPVFDPTQELENTYQSFSTIETPDTEEEKMKDDLMNTIEEIRPMSMDERPRLIKLVENKKFKTLLHKVNQCIHDLTPGDLTITELNLFTYSAALYIQRIHAPWFDEKKVFKNRKGKGIPMEGQAPKEN